MKYRRDGTRVFVRLETGESVHGALSELLEKERIVGGFVTGLGAVSEAVLGYYDRARKDYDRVEFPEEMEIASAAGTLSLLDGKPHVHLHAVLSGESARRAAGTSFPPPLPRPLSFLFRFPRTRSRGRRTRRRD